ncbi:MAG TPA: cyanophycinase [Longimicrobiaceae bacterium]|nr:cyanophycinase [Longimicrobiaceae bacterium]
MLKPTLILVFVTFFCSPDLKAQNPGGHLLIVGGGQQPPELVAHFVDLAGGPGEARIAVLPMASGSPEESGQGKVEQLQEFGADAFVMNITREEAEMESTALLLDGVTGVWFPGGDQVRLAPVLLDTPVLRTIKDLYMAGAVVAGTSAGAAVMSDSMITGEQFLLESDTAGYYGDEFPRVARNTIQIVEGFGFLPGTIIDQHFLQRERHNRLLSAVLEHPALIGVGIDESTAVQVNPDGQWRILGESAVIVYDARDAGITGIDDAVLGARDVRMHLLPAGSSYDPDTGDARLPVETAAGSGAPTR